MDGRSAARTAAMDEEGENNNDLQLKVIRYIQFISETSTCYFHVSITRIYLIYVSTYEFVSCFSLFFSSTVITTIVIAHLTG